MSHTFWERRLGKDAGAVGRALTIGGRPYDIIGVAPAGFAFPSRHAQLWTILPLKPPLRRGPYFLDGLGVLRPEASMAQAQADLRMADADVQRKFPSRNPFKYRVEPLKAVLTGDARPALILLLAAVAIVLLVAIVNVANLLLAQAAEREREIAVRAALGAGRARITRQLLTEGLVLATAGAAGGWMLALWATRVLVATAPAGLPRLTEIHMDLRVFGFSLATAAATGILSGASPALHLSRRSFIETMQSGLRSAGRPVTRRFRNGLVIVEIALALALAIGAALLARSLARLQRVEVGFDTDHIVTASIGLARAKYPDGARVAAFFDDLLERIERLPGVSGAAVTNSLPPDGLSETDNFVVEDNLPAPGHSAPVGPILSVTADYFRVLGVPLLSGRWFENADTPTSMPVAIISASLARLYFSGTDPIGRRIKLAANWPQPDTNPWLTVVGVAGDVKYAGLAGQTGPAFYVPLRQAPFRNQNLVVRATGDRSSLVNAVREVLRGIDADLPLADIQTMDERMWAAAGAPRFRTWLMSLFGVMGLVLAGIGVHGVVSYSVVQRTREIGIRAALGATRRDVLRLVLGESLTLTMLGTVFGLALALAGARFLAALLFTVSPTDLAALAGATSVLVAISVFSALLPARRAAAIDPTVALRAE